MRIKASLSIAIPIDYQEKLVPVIHGEREVVSKSAAFIKALRILDIPILVPRQYPKGLGDIVPEIKGALGDYEAIDKLSFSVCGEPLIMERIERSGRKNVIVFGFEAHVCVLQTVIDLLDAGYLPILVADCIGSRRPGDKKYAIYRARDEGAVITTSEAILFELTERAGTDTFKMISRLVK